MLTKVNYSLNQIYQGVGGIVDYSKTLTSAAYMFTSLEEMQEYIEKCERKPLDLENEEV